MRGNWKKGAALLCAAAVLAGGSASVFGKGGEDKDLKKVTVILDYVPNTNHTGMYVALDKGYYEEAGLDVEIIEPTDGATATLIAQQKGTFGISYQEDVTIALTAEDPLPIKAVAAVIQHNTSGFVSLADSGIQSPADFEGKTYAGWGGPGESAVLEACMNQAGKDFSKLNVVISDGSGFEALGKSCDLMWFFEGWDCVNAQMNDCALNYMELRQLDERLDYYTPVIITSDQVIQEDPEMVKAFLAATAKGYEDTIQEPEACAGILHGYAPDYDLEMLERSQVYLADKFMEDTHTWGVMKDEVWDNYAAFLQEYGVIQEVLPASDCYTNQFLGGQ
ncbi:MAG: ABC transporter substrate-binding protein [Eubacteriales bacterium]|nr:ABC transporter substrate-binding protein [Eubacteriales bacterium]